MNYKTTYIPRAEMVAALRAQGYTALADRLEIPAANHGGVGGGDEDGYDMVSPDGPAHRDVSNYVKAHEEKFGSAVAASLLRYVAGPDQCAACGKKPVDKRTTFLCCNQERYICAACWGRGENNEAWDLNTSNLIQLRDRQLARNKTTDA